MRLSRNFQLREFIRSQSAIRMQINNEPSAEAIAELQALVNNILQPLRDMVRRPINISSGYRSPALNDAIGGSQNSQHTKGQAADIECFGLSNAGLARMIYDNFRFDQLILEFHNPQAGPNTGWVHVSHRLDGDNRGESLRAIKDAQNVTQYSALDW